MLYAKLLILRTTQVLNARKLFQSFVKTFQDFIYLEFIMLSSTCLFYLIFLSIYVLQQGSCTTIDMEQAPTSQPTAIFVAPSVPEEFIGGDLLTPPSAMPTVSVNQKELDGETFEEEINEENRTAINSSSYIFFTFVALVGFVLIAYISKK